MNVQQRRAIETPCYLGFETTNMALSRKREHHSEVLSVNAGYE